MLKAIETALSSGKTRQWDDNIIFGCRNLNLDEYTLMKIQEGEFTIKEEKQTNKDLKIRKIILNQTIILGQSVKIIKFWTYKTPLYTWQLTSWLMHHLYVILELQVVGKKEKYFCSIQKDGQRIWVMHSHDFQGVRDQSPSKNGTTQKRKTSESHSTPIVLSYFQLSCDYFDFIQFLYENDFNKQKYGFLSANCQNFANGVEKHLRKYEKK